MSITYQHYLNKWYKRKWHNEYIIIKNIVSCERIYCNSYVFFTDVNKGNLLIDTDWWTDVDYLHDAFKEVRDNQVNVLELLYE